MRRSVSASLDLRLAGDANLFFAIAAAPLPGTSRTETLRFEQDGAAVEPEEIVDAVGGRLHCFVGHEGIVTARYETVVDGRGEPVPVEDLDLLVYLRPSRYCESDSLVATARAEFDGLAGRELLDAVSSWVGTRLAYVPGASSPTGGAVETLLRRQGVCRDYAHLVIALLRALDVPARLVAVYAPGLEPMDFHAVAEAYVEGAWHVVDATALAPRQSLLRIATGRDAADTAFLTSHWASVELVGMRVDAVVDELPADDVTELVRLG